MTTSPLEIIQAVERQIRAEVNMGMETLETSCASNLLTLQNRIRMMGKTVPMEQVTVALEHLGRDDGVFNQHQRRDIAETVKFLAHSEYITGQIIKVDGGRSL